MNSQQAYSEKGGIWHRENLEYIPTIHVLHAQHNVPGFILECPVKSHDVRGVAIMADLEFSQDLFPHTLFGINPDNLTVLSTKLTSYRIRMVFYLPSHDNLGRNMHDF